MLSLMLLFLPPLQMWRAVRVSRIPFVRLQPVLPSWSRAPAVVLPLWSRCSTPVLSIRSTSVPLRWLSSEAAPKPDLASAPKSEQQERKQDSSGSGGSGSGSGGSNKKKPGVAERVGELVKSVGAIVGLIGGGLALRDKIDGLFKDQRELRAVRELIDQSFELSARGVWAVPYALRREALHRLQPIAARLDPSHPEYVRISREVAHLAYHVAAYQQQSGRTAGAPTPYGTGSWASMGTDDLLQLALNFSLLANQHCHASSADEEAARKRLGVTSAELVRAERGFLSSLARHAGDVASAPSRAFESYATAVHYAAGNPLLKLRAHNNRGVTSYENGNLSDAVLHYERALHELETVQNMLNDKNHTDQTVRTRGAVSRSLNVPPPDLAPDLCGLLHLPT
jgi:hypothetical protein